MHRTRDRHHIHRDLGLDANRFHGLLTGWCRDGLAPPRWREGFGVVVGSTQGHGPVVGPLAGGTRRTVER